MKVLTDNINYYVDKHGPWPLRRIILRDIIQRVDPDVIALQAVRRNRKPVPPTTWACW